MRMSDSNGFTMGFGDLDQMVELLANFFGFERMIDENIPLSKWNLKESGDRSVSGEVRLSMKKRFLCFKTEKIW